MSGPVLVEYAVELLDEAGETVAETVATFQLVDERRLTLEPVGGFVTFGAVRVATSVVIRCLPEYGGRELGRLPLRRVF